MNTAIKGGLIHVLKESWLAEMEGYYTYLNLSVGRNRFAEGIVTYFI